MTDDRLRAELHPRGALGWRSFVRVSDMMHTGDFVPIGPITSPVVVDEAGRPVGVILHDILRARIV